MEGGEEVMLSADAGSTAVVDVTLSSPGTIHARSDSDFRSVPCNCSHWLTDGLGHNVHAAARQARNEDDGRPHGAGPSGDAASATRGPHR